MNYKITEIFYSIQSEGFNSGMPSIFIRFNGCNLNCVFCDENNKKEFKEYNIKSLFLKLEKYKCKNVILTGGEPAINIDQILLVELRKRGYKIFVETNGYEFLPCSFTLYDWITVSPKTENIRQINCNEIKIVYNGQTVKELENIIRKFNYTNNIFLQPESNKREYIEQIIKILENKKNWRLSIQWHKLINIK